MKESVDLIEQIIKEGVISDANLRLLVDSIVISEKDKKPQKPVFIRLLGLCA